MGKFKKGDKLKVICHDGISFLRDTKEFIFDHYEGTGDRFVHFQGYSGGWYSYRFELDTPAKPTGFEVGKKYKFKGSSHIYTVEYVSPTTGSALALNSKGVSVALVEYKNYVEYIPPPPEEWRIVYKNIDGTLRIGVMPFTSEEGAKTSIYWNGAAFKTIRVDA